ncbi:lantibiotic protection ABC transporter ATP-binding subunit [Enterococcus olivae]
MNNTIETQQLTKAFKGTTVLKNVSIKVPKGSVYGLLGPNGAGKSTLLKTLTGVLKADSGEILYQGNLWKPQDLKKIGAMIEGPAIYPNLTAKENLKVLATLLDIEEEQIVKVLRVVDLQGTGSKLVKHFSLGMKQRLGLAMALLNEPELLILDEPTNGLDPVGIQELRELIRQLSHQGMTVILSSHILSEVQQVADEVGIICNGHLSYEGRNNQKHEDLEQLFLEIIQKERRLQDVQ